MQPKLIVHVIDSLGLGGAEILLDRVISMLSEYRHTVVYLGGPDPLRESFAAKAELVCLNYSSLTGIFPAALRLRKLLRKECPWLVHAHLINSSLIARLATPALVPFVQSLHSIYSIDAFAHSKKMLYAERLTLKKRHALISVSDFVLDDYKRYVPFNGKSYVLYNFLPETYFDAEVPKQKSNGFRCLAVGNLKAAKNYYYLLEVFRSLKGLPVHLDIYGDGTERDALQETITKERLQVTLCGTASDLKVLWPRYHLFLQASEHEGFGLSVIEAIAARVPVLLSDIPVFREITGGHAFFFQLDDAAGAAAQLRSLLAEPAVLTAHTEEGFTFVQNRYNEAVYREKLLRIYSEITQ